jgi:ABC-2 type transport system ATP-binding protein
MLKVDGLTKRYGKFLANDHVSFQVEDGEVAIMIGPNGAGKSTSIKSIAGLLRFEGAITLDGHPNKSVEAKARLGYIPETPAVYDMLTVWEHMEFIARAYRLDGDWQARAEALLERFEMDDKRNKLGNELSKGMQQKVSICCALLHQPRIILFDEPLVGLDPHAIKELKLLFRELADGGASLIISTHMLDSVAGIWDKALILMKGKVAARLQRDHEEAEHNLEELFFSITEGEEA